MNPPKPETLHKIKSLLAEGYLKEALECFRGTQWENEALSIQTTLAKLELREDQGKFHVGEFQVELNRINGQVSELITRFKRGELPIEKSQEPSLWQQLIDSWKVLASGIGVIILFLTLIINLDKVSKIFEKWGLFENEIASSTSLFSIDSTYHVLLLPFGADGVCNLEKNQYHWQVQRRLDQLNRDEQLNLEIIGQDTVMCNLISPDSVKAYGKKLGADLVVYGDYQERCEWDTTLLTVRYLSLDSTARDGPVSTLGQQTFAVRNTMSLQELRTGKLTGSVEDIIYWVLGLKEYEKREYVHSLGYLDKIVPDLRRKEYAMVFKQIGNCYYYTRDYEQAEYNYSKAIELDLDYATAHRNLGNVYGIQKKYKLALAEYSKAIELDPEDPNSYFNRGTTYIRLKEYDKAITDYTRATKLNPEFASAYINRGVTYDYLKEYEEAIADFTRAIDLNPENANAYNNRGLLYEKLGDMIKAKQDFKDADSLKNLLNNTG